MSPSSRASNLAQLTEALAQLNSEFFLSIGERRQLSIKIQEFKDVSGRYGHYDPEFERELFSIVQAQLTSASLRELLAFSLVIEDHSGAMAPGSYPAWSSRSHLVQSKNELYEMVNPLILKISRPDFFNRLTLTSEFTFLKQF